MSLSETDSIGLLRRVGRAALGSAAILIVGAGAIPAADAAAAGVAGGLKLVSAQHSVHESGVSPSSLPTESRASAARFVVGENGKLTRVG
ncbi:hypothetical protein EFY87_15895 [Flexivirga caeni]|uniref:Uncharacterized protein n=1 Tax=Flexivirga caeni TaxID=2294115 RepID=A0A3M9M2T8_9MICO|nr:hypothetical protein EFY87_15895 [Flexivirga caeni]